MRLLNLFRKIQAETLSFRFELVCFVFFNQKVWDRVLYREKYLLRQDYSSLQTCSRAWKKMLKYSVSLKNKTIIMLRNFLATTMQNLDYNDCTDFAISHIEK